MLKRKLVLLGSPGVGKTSLVNRWVRGIFSEKYLQTIGVRIEKKELELKNNLNATVMIWDLAGNRDLSSCAVAYLRGASGLLFVVDGTRKETFRDSLQLLQQSQRELENLPIAFALNKQDQEELWEVSDHEMNQLHALKVLMVKTSAKTGVGVDEVFRQLALRTLELELEIKKPA
jgi:small GTP-binding protein